MRNARMLFFSAVAIAAFGCTRGGGGIARAPTSPTSSGAAVVTVRENPSELDENDYQQPVYNEQKGFEYELPPPESDANRAVTSDIGKPRMRNSLGTFIEDPSRYPLPHVYTPKGTAPTAQPANPPQINAPELNVPQRNLPSTPQPMGAPEDE